MVDNDACSNACKTVAANKSRKLILQAAPNSPNGLYMIDPDGNGGNPPFQTYCDMTTDGGGWTLILNRNVNSDQNGQPDINVANGVFDNTRATNWHFDVDLFWTDATQWMFADKQNDNCNNCAITGYDSAIRSDKPAGVSYSNACPGVSTTVNVKKIVGPQINMVGTAYQCGLHVRGLRGSAGERGVRAGLHDLRRVWTLRLLDGERVRLSPRTLEDWFYVYLDGGWRALMPKRRKDRDTCRAIRPEVAEKLLAAKRKKPRRSVNMLIRAFERAGWARKGELKRSTVHRLLQAHALSLRPPRAHAFERRSFLPEHAGDLWVGDAMHGPHTRGEGGREGKAYLISILDAATRYIVSSRFRRLRREPSVRQLPTCPVHAEPIHFTRSAFIWTGASRGTCPRSCRRGRRRCARGP